MYRKIQVALSLCPILLLVLSVTFVFADMQIYLKSGKIISVNVNKADIESIRFSDNYSGGTHSSQHGTNWNFETGNLQGWTKTGNAFNFQPTYGDNPTARRRGQASRHQGQYWIGTYEKRPNASQRAGQTQGDGPKGTLTSLPFRISQSGMNFLVGGGCDANTVRVELIVNGSVVRKATGRCNETMSRVRWSVSEFIGSTAQVRVVDQSSGGWGHINFDDLNFNN